jgi:hypothetical protein
LFSKASKGFSAASYVAEIEKLYGTMDKYTKSTADAARISDSLGMFLTLVKAEFLALLQPILNIITPLTQTETAMDGAAKAAKVLMGALLLFVSAQIINAITSVVGGIKSLASFMGLAAASTTAATRATIINANAQSYLAGAVGRLGTAQNALFVIDRQLELANAATIKNTALITKLTIAREKAVEKLAVAELSLAQTSTTANIALQGQVVATTAVTATTSLATRAVIGLRVAITAMALAAAAFLARMAVFAIVLVPVIILFKAFGDTITKYAIMAVNKLNEGLNYTANLLRRIAGQKPIEFKTLIPDTKGALGPIYPTPDGQPIPPGDTSENFVKKEQADASKALDETIRKLQEETKLQQTKIKLASQGTFYAETEANITKTIGDETAKLAKTNQTLSVEKAGQIRSAIMQSAQLVKQADITDIIKKSDTEVALLGIKDTKEREIQAQLREVIAKYGKMLNADDLASLDTALRINQAKKEQLIVEESLDRLRGKNIPQTTENALAGAALAQTDMEKLQATYDTQSDLLKQALDKNYITQESYQTALNNLQLAQYNGELDLVIRNFDAKQELNKKEINASAAKYAEMLIQAKDFNGQQLFTYDEAKQAALERAQFEAKTDFQKNQFMVQQGADMFNALGAHNKKAFQAAKAFNIANAIMSTYAGAAKALEMYPPPFSFIAAAAQVAFGFAQIAQIRAQTYSGKAVGGPVVGGQNYMVGEKGPETFRPSTAGTIIPNDQLGGGATNVTFNIVANDTRGFDQLLMERRPLITKIIRDAQLEQGRRQ